MVRFVSILVAISATIAFGDEDPKVHFKFACEKTLITLIRDKEIKEEKKTAEKEINRQAHDACLRLVEDADDDPLANGIELAEKNGCQFAVTYFQKLQGDDAEFSSIRYALIEKHCR